MFAVNAMMDGGMFHQLGLAITRSRPSLRAGRWLSDPAGRSAPQWRRPLRHRTCSPFCKVVDSISLSWSKQILAYSPLCVWWPVIPGLGFGPVIQDAGSARQVQDERRQIQQRLQLPGDAVEGGDKTRQLVRQSKLRTSSGTYFSRMTLPNR